MPLKASRSLVSIGKTNDARQSDPRVAPGNGRGHKAAELNAVAVVDSLPGTRLETAAKTIRVSRESDFPVTQTADSVSVEMLSPATKAVFCEVGSPNGQ